MVEPAPPSAVPDGLEVFQKDETTTVLLDTDTSIAPKLRRAARVCLVTATGWKGRYFRARVNPNWDGRWSRAMILTLETGRRGFGYDDQPSVLFCQRVYDQFF